MKKILLLILATMPLFCFAQKVDTKIDDFTGEKVVTTSWEKIYSGGATGKNQTRIRFRHEGGVDLIEFRVLTDCATSCNKGQEMLLKTNDGIIKVKNVEYTLAKPGDWTPNGINSKLGIYIVCLGSDLEKLSNETVTKMRLTFSDGYRDIALKEKDSSKLQELYNQFNKAK